MAVAAPNRKAEVKAIAAKYPQTFGEPANTQDARRRLLIPIIARELNKQDGGNWGVLYRNDRQDDDPTPGRLTADVIVWKPTMEHFDVLSANGAMWQGHGPITDTDWDWRDPKDFPTWDLMEPPAEPPPPPVDPPDPEFDRAVYTWLTELTETMKDQAKRLDVLEEIVSDPGPGHVEGTTGRTFGHTHTIRLPVKDGG